MECIDLKPSGIILSGLYTSFVVFNEFHCSRLGQHGQSSRHGRQTERDAISPSQGETISLARSQQNDMLPLSRVLHRKCVPECDVYCWQLFVDGRSADQIVMHRTNYFFRLARERDILPNGKE